MTTIRLSPEVTIKHAQFADSQITSKYRAMSSHMYYLILINRTRLKELKSSIDGYTNKDYIALYNAFKNHYSAKSLEFWSDAFFGNILVLL